MIFCCHLHCMQHESTCQVPFDVSPVRYHHVLSAAHLRPNIQCRWVGI
jgi:hypothetical protein